MRGNALILGKILEATGLKRFPTEEKKRQGVVCGPSKAVEIIKTGSCPLRQVVKNSKQARPGTDLRSLNH